jgi:putative FmdB family regulatory protein
MPLYDYKCLHGHTTTKLFKIAEYQSEVPCEKCGCVASRVFTPVPVFGDYAPYECPMTGKIISGRKEHEENLKRTGCRILEPGEREQFIKNKAKEEDEFDAKIEATAAEFVENLPPRKREQLECEMSHGIDAEIVRTTVTTD